MKTKLFLLLTLIFVTLFTSCKKTELFPETLKSNQLVGTTWEVLSVDSDSIHLSWSTKYPKITFNGNHLEMKLGRDICSKDYINTSNKMVVYTTGTCPISNVNHNQLHTLFDGEFMLENSPSNPNEIYIKSMTDVVFVLRRINSLTVSSSL
jgi:hypothetical protein